MAADAFGRVLPRNTPPVLRTSAQATVGAATAFLMAGGGPQGVIAAAVVAVIQVFAVPKPLIYLLVFMLSGVAFQYYRHRCWLRRQRLRSVQITIPLRM
jgi:hypothetical protein